MDLNKLYYFYTIAKHQHVTRAAEELRIAQPALSKAMRLLEQDLGIPLFVRKKRGIALTPYGQHLKDRLDGVFQVLNHIPAELEQLKQRQMHTVKLNVQMASLIVTEAIMRYKMQNSQVIFQVVQNQDSPDCDISVVSGDVAKLPAFALQHSIMEDIFLAVPQDSSYALLDAIDLRSVKDEWFISISSARQFRTICDQVCLNAGFKPNIIFESDAPIAVRNLISAGNGIGFWPAFSFGPVSENIKLLPILQSPCQRKVVIGLHDSNNFSQLSKDFYDYLIEYIIKQKESLQ